LELLISGSETSDALSNSNIKSLKTISGAKLLKGVEKSYDKGVKLLDASTALSFKISHTIQKYPYFIGDIPPICPRKK
jgi:hypothetical protein